MSDTTEPPAPQGGDASASEPAALTNPLAPGDTGAAPEPETEPTEAERGAARRIAQLSARYAGAARARDEAVRERDALAARITALEQRGGAPDDTLLEARAEQRAQQLYTERTQRDEQAALNAKLGEWHRQGRTAYPDWDDRCQALQDMGADVEMSRLLFEMPDGVRVVAALHDDPVELQRIAALKTERARAIALGQYSAKLEAEPPAAAPEPRPVSRAPRPINPVTGRYVAQFDEYRAGDAASGNEALVDYYLNRDRERRQQRR